MNNAIDMARPANDSVKEINAALAAHVARLASSPCLSQGYSFGVDLGAKFARVWKRLGTQESRSVVHFVDLTTGEIHGAKSWKSAGRPTGTRIPVVAVAS